MVGCLLNVSVLRKMRYSIIIRCEDEVKWLRISTNGEASFAAIATTDGTDFIAGFLSFFFMPWCLGGMLLVVYSG